MQISANKVVAISYTLKDDAGQVIDASGDQAPLHYLHAAGNILPGLEAALEGKVTGDTLSVRLAPGDGYGERSETMVQAVPRQMFGDHEVQVGAQYNAAGPNGEALLVTVVAVDDDQVTVDGNHPLAGVALNFDVEVVEVREGTAEEIAHGHVHGPGGHHHG